MSNSNNSRSGGVGLVGLLTVAFVVLKLCGVISWSWWWVLSPLWIAAGLWIVIVAVWLVVVAVLRRKIGL